MLSVDLQGKPKLGCKSVDTSPSQGMSMSQGSTLVKASLRTGRAKSKSSHLSSIFASISSVTLNVLNLETCVVCTFKNLPSLVLFRFVAFILWFVVHHIQS